MSPHTPGPWDIGPDGFGNWTVYRVENGHEIASIYPDGYQLFGGDGWEEQMDADARLIAAAPMMYELLLAVAANPTTNYSSKIADLLWRIKGDEDEEEDEE